MNNWGFALSVFLLVARLSPSAETSAYPHAYVSHVEGELSLQRAAEPEPEPGAVNLPVLPGDRIWTHQDSRAEVRLAGESVLRLSGNTKVDFVELGTETIVRVWSGSVILKLAESRENIRLDSPAGSVHPTEAGTYRIDVQGDESLTLSVVRGTAELGSSAGSVLVRSGETSYVAVSQQPDIPRLFNTASYDEFDSWSDRRDQSASTVRQVEVRSIPYEVQSYARDLSYHGDWIVDAAYGSVWYPSVSVGWAPYRQGRWCYTRYGYTWVSYEPWGWAPYHYGRWGHGNRGWYWIPGAHWSPAWVSFAVGPFWVGWSPLGYHDRPVYVFDQYVNHHRNRYPRPYGPHGHDGGWNFATRDDFGRRTAHARLDPSLVRASASRAQMYDGGAVLDRNLKPREDRRGRWAGSNSGSNGGGGYARGYAGPGESNERGRGERAIVSGSRGVEASVAPSRSERAEAQPRARQGITSSTRVDRSGTRSRDSVYPGYQRNPNTANTANTANTERPERTDRVERRSERETSPRNGRSEIVTSPYRNRPSEEASPRGNRSNGASPRTERPSERSPSSNRQPTAGYVGRVERSSPRVERNSRGVATPRVESPTRQRSETRPSERSRSGVGRVERSSPRSSSPSMSSGAGGGGRRQPSSSSGVGRSGSGSRGTAKSKPREN